MTVTCPSGHASATTDYCDQCGAPIAVVRPANARAGPAAGEEEDTSAAAAPAPCPRCGAPRSGGDRYCEGCGNDFLAPAQKWEAVANADRGQFDRLAVPGLKFPAEYGERRFALDSSQVRIGRSRGRHGELPLEIDLAGVPEDPAISHLHAILERQADGTWTLRDLGSTNGTSVNDDPAPIGTQDAVALAAGDRIRLGAWTTITVRLSDTD
jgi:hypothetical protein